MRLRLIVFCRWFGGVRAFNTLLFANLSVNEFACLAPNDYGSSNTVVAPLPPLVSRDGACHV